MSLLELTVLLLGILHGFGVAVVLGVAWILLADPCWEWLLERFVDRGSHDEPRRDPGRVQGVLISDLHIDTWFLPRTNTDKSAEFHAFLDALREHPTIRNLYFAGDLMDIPLHPLNYPHEPLMLSIGADPVAFHGVLQPQLDATLERLTTLGRDDRLQCLMMTGNHDIGVNGFRYARSPTPPFMPSVQTAWSPSVLLTAAVGGSRYARPIYVEHGHRWDPFLWLYMRYALLDITRGGYTDREAQLAHGMQRGGRVGMVETVSHERRVRVTTEPDTLWHFQDSVLTFGEQLVKLRYRLAARKLQRRLRRDGVVLGAIVFGHTHIPDRYTFDDGCVYVNSGDWAGNTEHRAYSLVEADGFVRGPYQWSGTNSAAW